MGKEMKPIRVGDHLLVEETQHGAAISAVIWTKDDAGREVPIYRAGGSALVDHEELVDLAQALLVVKRWRKQR